MFNDAQLMQRWLDDRSKSSDARSATFYNLIPLHDGTRDLGSTKTAPWKPRAQLLFDQLDAFMNQLEKSGRRVMVSGPPVIYLCCRREPFRLLLAGTGARVLNQHAAFIAVINSVIADAVFLLLPGIFHAVAGLLNNLMALFGFAPR